MLILLDTTLRTLPEVQGTSPVRSLKDSQQPRAHRFEPRVAAARKGVKRGQIMFLKHCLVSCFFLGATLYCSQVHSARVVTKIIRNIFSTWKMIRLNGLHNGGQQLYRTAFTPQTVQHSAANVGVLLNSTTQVTQVTLQQIGMISDICDRPSWSPAAS